MICCFPTPTVKYWSDMILLVTFPWQQLPLINEDLACIFLLPGLFKPLVQTSQSG